MLLCLQDCELLRRVLLGQAIVVFPNAQLAQKALAHRSDEVEHPESKPLEHVSGHRVMSGARMRSSARRSRAVISSSSGV